MLNLKNNNDKFLFAPWYRKLSLFFFFSFENYVSKLPATFTAFFLLLSLLLFLLFINVLVKLKSVKVEFTLTCSSALIKLTSHWFLVPLQYDHINQTASWWECLNTETERFTDRQLQVFRFAGKSFQISRNDVHLHLQTCFADHLSIKTFNSSHRLSGNMQ